MTSQVLKIGREKLAACITCRLCNKLLRDATTISECLHTFCRKCICGKITYEKSNRCPVCKIFLGCAPLEKLRSDHNLEDLRTKIFPSKRQKSKILEAEPSVPLLARRKERFLSSLVIDTPRVSPESASTGRRRKYARKIDHSEILGSIETLTKIAHFKRQNSSKAESSKKQMPSQGTKDNVELLEEKPDRWKPLNGLVIAANKTKSNNLNLPVNITNMALPKAHENEEPINRAEVKRRGRKPKVYGHENGSTPTPSGSMRRRNLQGIRQSKTSVSERMNIPSHSVVATNRNYYQRFSPIWFSLVSSDNQEGDIPLPQITSCYLRVKDGRLPVAFIQKYLAKKLDLSSEDEVEISFLGEPLNPTVQLHSLIDLWSKATSVTETIQASAGTSGEDFVMALSYGRKAQHP